jgi:hypothetical protein
MKPRRFIVHVQCLSFGRIPLAIVLEEAKTHTLLVDLDGTWFIIELP